MPFPLHRPVSPVLMAAAMCLALSAPALADDPLPQPWPGSASVTTVDQAGALGADVSGLDYEGTRTRTRGVLWAVDNSGSLMLRLVWNGTQWVRDIANGWSAGKTLRFPGGAGRPDSEGVTVTDAGSAGGVFVSSESNLAVVGVSRISVLRYNVSGATAILTATREWNLTPDLPVVGSNAGGESVEWVPDAYLVSSGFVDETTNQPYDPADYPGHGTGLFFIGLEANGIVYAYALNQTSSSFTRVATFASGFTTFGALHWDAEENQLWVVCDNNCDGRSRVFEVDSNGSFAAVADYARPTGMANLNNEGFAITPDIECIGGRKPVYWADDGNTGGHALRAGTISCTPPPNDLLVDFGTSGLFQRMNNIAWLKVHNASPLFIAAGDLDGNFKDEAIATFAGQGLWARYNNATWTKLHAAAPARFVAGDLDGNGRDELIVVFGSGIFARYNNVAPWVKLHASVPQALAVGDLDGNGKDELLVDFGASGLYARYNNVAPIIRLHSSNPTFIATGDLDGNGKDELIAAFGASGVYARYNNAGGFVRLTASVAQGLATGDLDGGGKDELLVDLGSLGLRARYNNRGGFVVLHATNPVRILATDLDNNGKAEAIASFPGTGLFARYNNAGAFVRLSPLIEQGIAAGGFD